MLWEELVRESRSLNSVCVLVDTVYIYIYVCVCMRWEWGWEAAGREVEKGNRLIVLTLSGFGRTAEDMQGVPAIKV